MSKRTHEQLINDYTKSLEWKLDNLDHGPSDLKQWNDEAGWFMTFIKMPEGMREQTIDSMKHRLKLYEDWAVMMDEEIPKGSE